MVYFIVLYRIALPNGPEFRHHLADDEGDLRIVFRTNRPDGRRQR